MRAYIFNRREVELYRIVEEMELYIDGREDEVTSYSHMFGGEAMHQGTVPPGCKHPVHAFFSLDFNDPRLDVKHPNKKLGFLPLYYPLGNCGGPFTYRVIDAGNIEMFSHPYPPKWRQDIQKKYPEPFEATCIELVACDYDPKDVNDVFFCAGVLGIDALTAAERIKLRKDFLKMYIDEIGTDLIAADYDGDDTVPVEEIVSGYTPFTQGMPDDTCPNPKCKVHKAKTALPVFAFVTPEKDDPFYRRIAGPDDGQLIWQYCEKCGSFVVTNPIT
jgi:hypothetical protein